MSARRPPARRRVRTASSRRVNATAARGGRGAGRWGGAARLGRRRGDHVADERSPRAARCRRLDPGLRRAAPLTAAGSRSPPAPRGHWRPPQVGARPALIAADPRVAVKHGATPPAGRGGAARPGRRARRAARRPRPRRVARRGGHRPARLVEPGGRVDAIWTTRCRRAPRSEIRFATRRPARAGPAATLHRRRGGRLTAGRRARRGLALRRQRHRPSSGGHGCWPSAGRRHVGRRGSSRRAHVERRLGGRRPGRRSSREPALDEVSGIAEPLIYWATRRRRRAVGGRREPGAAPTRRRLADGTGIAVDDRGGIEASARPPAARRAGGADRARRFPVLATAGATAAAVWLQRGRLAMSAWRP